MSEKMSIQDYYYHQRRIAEKYDISENHAGCYIAYYHCLFCTKCKHAGKCHNIHEKEKKNEQ